MKNIILIGMAGSGKSTIGVLLAKSLGMPFIDTDLIIQERENKLLQDIINQYGIEEFLKIEEKALLSLNLHGTVIATGGSAVYSSQAMSHLKKNGRAVYIKVGYDEIKKSVYITKLYPHECGIEVNNASSIKEKRCHCDLINASNDLLPVEYCYCAAKFYYPLFSSVFGSKIEIEPLETVLNGGNKCTFKISNLGGNLL